MRINRKSFPIKRNNCLILYPNPFADGILQVFMDFCFPIAVELGDPDGAALRKCSWTSDIQNEADPFADIAGKENVAGKDASR